MPGTLQSTTIVPLLALFSGHDVEEFISMQYEVWKNDNNILMMDTPHTFVNVYTNKNWNLGLLPFS